MSIFSYIFGKKEIANETDSKKEIHINEIDKWIKDEDKKNAEKNYEMTSKLNEWREKAVTSLRMMSESAQNISMSKYKSEERIKAIVEENYRLYLNHVQTLMNKISTIEMNNAFEGLKELEKVFSDFEKDSFISYQKATILIGKEFGDMKEVIKQSGKSLLEISVSYEPQFNKIQVFNKLKELVNSRKMIEESIGKIKSEKDKLENFKENIIEKEFELAKRRADFMKSEEYKKMKEDDDEYQKELESLGKELSLFRQDLSLKFLQKKYHAVEKNREFLKLYDKDIRNAIEKDSEELIVRLAIESQSGEFPSSLSSITAGRFKDLKKKINANSKPRERNEKIEEYESDLGKLNSEMEYNSEQIANEEGKIEKFTKRIEENDESIRRIAVEYDKNLIFN